MNPGPEQLPRPRPGLAACVELAWRWWLMAMLGLLLLVALLAGLQRAQAQGLREARLEIALQSLRERLQTNLALGFDLAGSHQAQAMLEDLLADDPTLVAAEVFDAGAISLFSTDRGAIGEQVPAEWLLASTGAQAGVATDAQAASLTAWRVVGEEDFTLGLPVHGPFGELAGQVCITSALAPPPSPWPVLAAALAAAFGLTLATLVLARLSLRALASARDEALMDQAATRLQRAEQRIAGALDGLAQAREPL
ncbi:hypothetical protein [Comamonas flocculans]|uniref:Uncharacterized protein n=1 Tax=Comamonas flocculans TaxID=2597701 RepID=A0A5B8RWW1_9BURK|nr:hypothetical protein [Comamonas flocculans]QEA13152.1 hypothetical protein FOZ74_08965 [Comamonas flocculans]